MAAANEPGIAAAAPGAAAMGEPGDDPADVLNRPFRIGDVCNNIIRYTKASGNRSLGNGQVVGIVIKLDAEPMYGREFKYVLFTNDFNDVATAQKLSHMTQIVGLELPVRRGGKYNKSRRMRKTRSRRR